MKTPTFVGMTKQQTDYVEYLESIVNGYSSLSSELNIVSGIIALEIKQIRSKGSIMDDEKAFDKILRLIDKRAKIDNENNAGRPKKEEKIEESPVKRKSNIQDFVLNK